MMKGGAGTVRITGGHLRGRRLKVLPAVRPAKDQVREAVFSSLGPQILEARVLDLCCGSGAYGVEAMSRGAASLVAVDRDTAVVRQLQTAVRELLPEADVQVQRLDALHFARGYLGRPFDLVFADPPYSDAGLFVEQVLPLLHEKGVVDADTVLIFEAGRENEFEWPAPWICFWQRRYGLALIHMLRVS